jgi:hypothetical protein
MTLVSVTTAFARIVDHANRAAMRDVGLEGNSDFDAVLEGWSNERQSIDDGHRSEKAEDPVAINTGVEENSVMVGWLLCAQQLNCKREPASDGVRSSGQSLSPEQESFLNPSDSGIGQDLSTGMVIKVKTSEGPVENAGVMPGYDRKERDFGTTLLDSSHLNNEKESDSDRKLSPMPDRGGEKVSQPDVTLTPTVSQEPFSLSGTSPAQQILSQISGSSLQAAGTSEISTLVSHIDDQPDVPRSEVIHLRFMLQPEMLGDVEVALRRMGSDTSVTIIVAGKAASDALTADMAILEDRLGSLFAIGGMGSLSISMEIRSPETDVVKSGLAEGGHSFGSATFSEGRSFDGDSRSGSSDHRSHRSAARDPAHEKDSSMEPRTGDSRVV